MLTIHLRALAFAIGLLACLGCNPAEESEDGNPCSSDAACAERQGPCQIGECNTEFQECEFSAATDGSACQAESGPCAEEGACECSAGACVEPEPGRDACEELPDRYVCTSCDAEPCECSGGKCVEQQPVTELPDECPRDLDAGCSEEQVFVVGEGCVSRFSTIPSTGNLIANPGFEGEAPQIGSIPDTAGIWQGDRSVKVGPRDGITPVQNAFMLRCEGAAPEGPAVGVTGCEVLQAVLPVPASGAGRTARVTAFVNRVEGTTATRFGFNLDAYDGDVSEFPTKYRNGSALERVTPVLESDPCINTWERITAEVSLDQQSPVTFLGVTIFAIETVDAPEGEAEFEGHYFDAVSLTIVESE